MNSGGGQVTQLLKAMRAGGTGRLEEARAAIGMAWDVYREAGIDRYNSMFETPLRSLNDLIASRRSSP